MKINIFKKKDNFKKENPEVDIELYWELIVLFMFALILGSFAFGIYLFLQTNKEPTFDIKSSGQVEIVSKDRIEKVLEYFPVRDKKSNQILNSPAPIIDPSF